MKSNGRLTHIQIRKQIAAALLIFFLSVFQIFPAYGWTENDFRVISGGYDSFSCDASGNCTFNGLQDGTIIEWLNGFSIAAGSSMSFLFTNLGSVMNRDISGNISNILGNLFSNGTVFIINPAGINFGASAMIDVGSLVASSLNISNENFLAGNYTFENGAQAGMVINNGTITVQPGGFAALLGSSVHNAGQIIAQMGSVALAVGETITLTFDPQGLINIAIPQPLADRINNESEVAIANTGLIRADGGKVILRADTIQNLFNQLINNTGIIEANSVAVRNGVVELIANGGSVENSGVVRANGTSENSNGGSIYIRGDDIHQYGLLQANALDYGVAGNLDVVALYDLWLHTGSISQARGQGTASNGGYIYMYAHRNGYFEEGSVIDLSGGELGGHGGSGEFSAHETLEIGGVILNDIQDGYQLGSFLFDPTDIVFSGNTICGGTCVYQADRHITFNANATVTASNGGLHFIADFNNDGVGNITMNANSAATARDYIYLDGAGTANLQKLTTTGAGSSVKIGSSHPFGRIFSGVTFNGVVSAVGSVIARTTGNIAVNQNITSSNGVIDLGAAGSITLAANRVISGNAVTLTADTDNNLAGTVTMNAGSSIVANSGDVLIDGSQNATLRNIQSILGAIKIGMLRQFANVNSAGNLSANSDIQIKAGTNISSSGTMTSANGSLMLTAGQDISLSQNVSAANGNITISATRNITVGGIVSTVSGFINMIAGQDITVNQNITSSSGNVSLSAIRNITIGANRTVSGNNVTINADSENNLVGNFTMNAGSSVVAANDLSIKGAGNVTLRTVSAGNHLSVQSTNGSILDDGNNATLLSADQVTLTAKNGIGASGANGQIDLSTNFLTATASNGSIFAANNKALTVNSASSTNGSVTIAAAGTLTANNISATGTGTNTISLTASSGDLIVGSLTADNAITLTSSAGNILDDGNALTQITINSTSLLSMNAFGSIGTLLNPIQINNASGHLSNLTANQDLFASFASGNINFSGYSILGGQATLNTNLGTFKYGTSSNLGLTARNGNITNSANITLLGNEISLSGIALGTSGQNIKTNANSLRLNSSTGDIFVTESNGATVNATSTSGNINVTTTTGDLSVGAVSTSGNITLRALAGNLFSASSSVVGNIVTLIGNAIGTSVSQINTNANVINATASGAGEIWITEADSATVNGISGSGDIHFTSTSGNLGIGTVATAGNAFLTALNGDLISQASSITANIVNLIGNAIGANGAVINTNANTVNTTASGAGETWVTDSNNATFNATAGTGDIHLTTTTGDLSIGTITTAGNAFLTALNGDLISQASNLSANIVNLIGNSIGTILDRINTNANVINATANNGNIYLTEANGASLSANSSAANGAIDVVSTTGDLTLQEVNAGSGSVLLQATSGSILDGNGASNNITAGSNSSLSAAGTIGTTTNGLDVTITDGASLTVRANSQDGSGASINLDGSINGELVDPSADLDYGQDNNQTPPGFVIFNGNTLFPDSEAIAFSPITGPIVSGLTELISPLFTQDYTRRKPAILAQ